LALDPNDLEALRLRAQVDFNQGKIQSAAQTFGKMLKQTPDDLEVLLPLGVCFFKVGDYEAAKMVFERILELKPGHPLAAENLKVAEAKLSSPDQSMPAISKAAGPRVSPPPAEAHGVAVSVESPSSERSAAARAFEEYLVKANSLWGAGDLGGAAAALREALNANPDSHEVRATLGSLLYQMGDLSGSYEELHRATQILPNSSDYQTRLGLALLGEERRLQALDAVEPVAQFSPTQSQKANAIAVLPDQLGKLVPPKAP
jgi:tetratricopeptide (TPR) repeat protein